MAQTSWRDKQKEMAAKLRDAADRIASGGVPDENMPAVLTSIVRDANTLRSAWDYVRATETPASSQQEKSLSFVLVVPQGTSVHPYVQSVRKALTGMGIKVNSSKGTNARVAASELRVTGLHGVTIGDIGALSGRFPVKIDGNYVVGAGGVMVTPPRGSNATGRTPERQRQCNSATEDGSRCERAADTQIGPYGFCWQHRNTIKDNPNWRVNPQHFP